MNEKGFSLVELIIVIAIMAILVGMLVPQYIKHVEKARKSVDDNTAESLLDSAHAMVTDEVYVLKINNQDKIQFGNQGISVSPVNAAITEALNEYYGDDWESRHATAKAYKGSEYVITFVKTSTSFLIQSSWQTE